MFYCIENLQKESDTWNASAWKPYLNAEFDQFSIIVFFFLFYLYFSVDFIGLLLFLSKLMKFH